MSQRRSFAFPIKNYLPDGTYAVPDAAEVLSIPGRAEFEHELEGFPTYIVYGSEEVVAAHAASVNSFLANYPDAFVAEAYEVDDCFYLISEKPQEFHTQFSFNYGVCALIEDCPRRLLILAQND